MSNLMQQVDDSTKINLNKQKLDYKLNVSFIFNIVIIIII